MKLPSKLVLQGSLFFLALIAIAFFFSRGPLSRFFRINRAHYYSNLSDWNKTLELLGKIESNGTQAATIAELKADALLQKGDPFRAMETWEGYLAASPEEKKEGYEPVYGFALLLGRRRAEAADYFKRSDDPYAKAMAAYLSAPSPDTYNSLFSMTTQRYERRWLYVGIVQWVSARFALDEGRADEALRILRPLVDRFPWQSMFLFEFGEAYLRLGDTGLASSYLLAAMNALESRYPPDSASRIRTAWKDDLSKELVQIIYSGDPATALSLMRALAVPLDLDAAKPAAILLNQEGLSPALAFNLNAFLIENAKVPRDSKAVERALAQDREWIEWFAAIDPAAMKKGAAAAPPPLAALTPLLKEESKELSSASPEWAASLAPPGPEVGRRVLLLRMKAVPQRGVGAAIVLAVGWKADMNYVREQPEWQAFDVPLTVGDPVNITLRIHAESLPAIDAPAEGQEGRRLVLLDALLVDFKRKT